MSLITSTRNQQSTLINQNKASIIITRTAKTLASGAYTTVDSVLASQDFRLYSKRTRILNVGEGGWFTERLTKMTAKYNANVLRKSATNIDKFTYGSRNYYISDVKNFYTAGSIVFKECMLEEIK